MGCVEVSGPGLVFVAVIYTAVLFGVLALGYHLGQGSNNDASN